MSGSVPTPSLWPGFLIQGQETKGKAIITSITDLAGEKGDRLPRTPTTPRVMLVAVGAGLSVALAFAFWHRPQEPPAGIGVVPQPRTAAQAVAPVSTLVTVHVSGAVHKPGLVVLEAGSRVADAVAAAGGGLPGSDLGRINLAAVVTDGVRLVVPWFDAGIRETQEIRDGDSHGFPVDVNRAGVDRLVELPGVGEVLAARILAYRDAHGPFTVLEDLLDVPGIGEGKLAGLRDFAVVDR